MQVAIWWYHVFHLKVCQEIAFSLSYHKYDANIEDETSCCHIQFPVGYVVMLACCMMA